MCSTFTDTMFVRAHSLDFSIFGWCYVFVLCVRLPVFAFMFVSLSGVRDFVLVICACSYNITWLGSTDWSKCAFPNIFFLYIYIYCTLSPSPFLYIYELVWMTDSAAVVMFVSCCVCLCCAWQLWTCIESSCVSCVMELVHTFLIWVCVHRNHYSSDVINLNHDRYGRIVYT